ncbi:hypothetical protein NQ318_019837 [Aromia moschata]|uniref:Aspartate aminotransferase n=1 Tax=Aromia moschata TaxID=1265417 RepID=A0AAV8YKQ9_9CUCU|nr:hypothetical protein NQ318_019837 [Aromia moschata]
MSFFSEVKTHSIDVFELFMRFHRDTHENKLNLAIGVAYRDDSGLPWTLPVVRTAEQTVAEDENLDNEYLPVLGLEEFTTAATRWLLGSDSIAVVEKRAFGVQSISGANALRLGAEFLSQVLGKTVFYYSNPTWRSHELLFKNGGMAEARQYRYWSEKTKNLDFDGLLEDLESAPRGSVVILHACAQNPTGCDPTEDQWRRIAGVMREKGLFPFFDTALQGFASGDLVRDAFAVRLFERMGFELFCAQSFSKNLGLYNERVGNLVVVLNDPKLVDPVKSQFTLIVRGMYSNPPSHGARIASYILNNTNLYDKWQDNVLTMFTRMKEMRGSLRGALEQLGAPGDWSLITRQVGMACDTGLTESQCEVLIERHHIYVLKSGRFNICAVTSANVDLIAKAIYDVFTS